MSEPNLEELMPDAYEDLKRLAAAQMAREGTGHTLQPTAVVHEVYLSLAKADELRIKDRLHFLTLAARAIRRILIDHARRKHADRRGGKHERVFLDDTLLVGVDGMPRPIDVLDLEDALERLGQLNPRHAAVIELRFFAGLSVAETAATLEVSVSTIEKDWTTVRMWLARELA